MSTRRSADPGSGWPGPRRFQHHRLPESRPAAAGPVGCQPHGDPRTARSAPVALPRVVVSTRKVLRRRTQPGDQTHRGPDTLMDAVTTGYALGVPELPD